MSILKQRVLALAAAILFGMGPAFAQGAAVKALVVLENQKQSPQRLPRDSPAVVWLMPAKGWAGFTAARTQIGTDSTACSEE